MIMISYTRMIRRVIISTGSGRRHCKTRASTHGIVRRDAVDDDAIAHVAVRSAAGRYDAAEFVVVMTAGKATDAGANSSAGVHNNAAH